MALGPALTYVYYAVLVAGIIYTIYMMSKGMAPPDDMSPNSLGDFNITTAQEGLVVPIVFGRWKITGNIMWFGNLRTVEITEEVDTGGGFFGLFGGGSEEVIVGYKYYLDIWQGLAMGKLSIVTTYIQEEEKDVDYSSILFNDGENGVYPTYPGEYAAPLPGISHVFYRRMYLGDNVTYVPTVHFVVEHELPASVTGVVNYATMTDGVNPAAIIYALLKEAGATATDINTTSFNTAAAYWNTKGYALNIVFNRQQKCREMIEYVLSFVGGAFGQDENWQFYLNPFDESDTPTYTLSDANGDFIKFKFKRKTWEDVYSHFTAKYVDAAQDYSERTVSTYNPAVYQITRVKKQLSLDLTAFRTVDIASKRIWEIMKEASYPYAELEITTNLKWYRLNIGDAVYITNARYGISNAPFRIVRKELGEIDSNEITMYLRQMTEKLFDANYTSSGGTYWSPPDYSPDELAYSRVFELPYIAGELAVKYLLLASRTNIFETGFTAWISIGGAEYTREGIYSTFSQRGTLSEACPGPGECEEIDFTIGILYATNSEDPAFSTISIEAALTAPRIAIIENEIIGFANVAYEGGSDIRLTGVIRGMFNTTIASHASGTEIWITTLGNNVITGVTDASFNLKLCPYSHQGSIDPSSVDAISVTKTNKAVTPLPPNFRMIRRATNLNYIELDIDVVLKNNTGAGLEFASVTDFATMGSDHKVVYEFYLGTGAWEVHETTSAKVYHYKAGSTSSDDVNQVRMRTVHIPTNTYSAYTPTLSCADFPRSVDTANLDVWYWMPRTSIYAGSGYITLTKLRYGQSAWSRTIDRFFLDLNDTIRIDNLPDVDSLLMGDDNVLIWNASEEKFEAVHRDTVSWFPPTTTTTSPPIITTTTGPIITTTSAPFTTCATHTLNGTNEIITWTTSQAGKTIRMTINNSRLDFDASRIRILFEAYSVTYGMDISEVWVGHASGTNQNFDGNQAQVYFGGSSSVSLDPGDDVWSDEVIFDLDETTDLILSVYMTPTGEGGSGYVAQDITSQSGLSIHSLDGNYAGDTTFSGSYVGGNQLWFITAICVTQA